jgi:hypothetical protein
MSASPMEIVATTLFALAVLHTFSTRFFEHLAHIQPAHAGIWHLLGEVEVVFGFWAMVLVVCMTVMVGWDNATGYLDSRNYTEPLFVFAIMVVAGSRPILHCAGAMVGAVARLLPLRNEWSLYFCTLALVPLLGSFITEPAAMTLAALMLRERYFGTGSSKRFRYATLGVLFVNISIGGVLTPFAAPPVLMVASTWGWDIAFMMTNFGWKAALAVLANAAGVTWLLRSELASMANAEPPSGRVPPPPSLIVVHLLFLTGIVISAHHPPVFMGLLLFFMGVATAYVRHQDRLMLREGLLVAFFLAGLVVLGGMQQWWLKPLLLGMSADAVYWGATGLTAITDNAALTYLGSLVPGLSPEFQYALVAGAVTGGGLTVIANAPNPAGVSILRSRFEDGAISPLFLLLSALAPTAVAAAAFLLL